jgi:hypothetical protein
MKTGETWPSRPSPKGVRPLTYDIFVRNPKLDRRGSMARISMLSKIAYVMRTTAIVP